MPHDFIRELRARSHTRAFSGKCQAQHSELVCLPLVSCVWIFTSVLSRTAEVCSVSSANSYTYPLYLPLYAVRLPLPRLARFHLTYFFSILTICLIYTNSSALLSVFFSLSDVSLWCSDEYRRSFFFFFLFSYSSPSAKMLMIKDTHIN